jgi:hypothetical protein
MMSVSFNVQQFEWRIVLYLLFLHLPNAYQQVNRSGQQVTAVSMRIYGDHRVNGSLVVPGASHLGLGGASCLALTTRTPSGVTMHGIFFQLPFIITAEAQQQQKPTTVMTSDFASLE